jgi:teichuronic acid biosynthesis protein TuaE
MKKLFWFLFITSAIWGAALPGITIPLVGTMYPLRIILILVVLLTILQKKRLFQNHLLARRTYHYFGIMLLYGALAILWASNKSVAIKSETVYITSFLVLVTCIAYIRNNKDLNIVCKTFLLNVWVIGLLAIYESLTGEYIFYDGFKYFHMYNLVGLKMPVLFFGNVNNMATFMAVALPICFIACESMKFKLTNKISIFILCSAVVVLVNSRAAFIAVLLFILLYLMYQFNIKKLFIYAIMGVVLIQLFGEIIFEADVWNIFETINNEDIRLLVWKNTLLTASDSLFIGAGPGNGYLANLQQYYDTGGVLAIHNYFLEILSEFGLIGFICFVAWFIKLLIELTRARRCVVSTEFNIYNMFFIFMLQYVILSVCASSLAEMYFMWLIWGMCIASLLINRDKVPLNQSTVSKDKEIIFYANTLGN